VAGTDQAIEAGLERRFGRPALVCPSGRLALFLALTERFPPGSRLLMSPLTDDVVALVGCRGQRGPNAHRAPTRTEGHQLRLPVRPTETGRDHAVAEAAGRLGYDRAVTVSFRRVSPPSPPLALPPIPVRHDSTALLAATIDGRLDVLGRPQDGRSPALPATARA